MLQRFRHASSLLPAVTISTLVFVLYAQSFYFDFTFDDFFQIVNNQVVADSSITLHSLLSPFTSATIPGDLYRPLTLLSYRINYLVFGHSAASFHLVNVFLHLANSLLVVRLARATGLSSGVAFAAGAVFAVHPIHIEAVASVIGRAELLSSLLGLSAILIATGARLTPVRITGSTLLFLLACLSKESALTILPLILIFSALKIDRCYLDRHWKTLATTLCCAAVLTTGARYVVLQNRFLIRQDLAYFHSENPLLFGTSFIDRVIPSLKILGDYLTLLIFPLNLSIDYSISFADYWSSVYSAEGAQSVCLIFFFLGLLYYFRSRLWSLYGAWFFITFALTANLLTVIGTIMGERLAYLPSVGFCIYLPALVEYLARKRPSLRRVIPGLTVALCFLFLAIGYPRVEAWRDNATLFQQAIIDQPRNPKAHFNLAMFYLLERGELDSAENSFRNAFSLQPTMIPAALKLMEIAIRKNEYNRAEYWARKALELSPNQELAKGTLAALTKMRSNEVVQ